MIDYQAIQRAHVYLRGIRVGVLEKTGNKHSIQSYSFQYESNYLETAAPIPIACAIPLRSEPYVSPYLHPFFDNMILEGWLLSYAERVFHIDKKNRFAMLMAVGRSPIGAVSVHALDGEGNEIAVLDAEPEQKHPTRTEIVEFPNQDGNCPACLKRSPKGRILHARCETELLGTSRKIKIELDAERPVDTFSKTIYGGSISGAQRKGLFSLDTKSGILSPGPEHSLYILKPDGDYPELPANEHLTMAIAKELGFVVPPFSLIHVPKLGMVFMIRRFDRVDGQQRRMEDMAQVIGESSEDKYESSNEKVAKAIRQYAAAAPLDLREFLKRLLFCFLVANADMHLKNWSLLEKLSLNGEMELSPCYDLLNTRIPIPKESVDIGLSIRGKKKNLQRSYFFKFGEEELKIDGKYLEKNFALLKQWLETVRELTARSYLTDDSKEKYIKLAEERCEILLA